MTKPTPRDPHFCCGKTIAVVGDSITAGVGASNAEACYASILGELLNAKVHNLGVSGSTLCAGGHRWCNFHNFAAEKLLGARLVTVMMGINDWDQGVDHGCQQGQLLYSSNSTYYALGNLGSDDKTTIYGASKMWCSSICRFRDMAGFEDTEFFFITPVITSWNRSITELPDWNQSKRNIHGFTLQEMCSAIAETCAVYDVPVLDLNRQSSIYYNSPSDCNAPALFADGIHPNDAGHRVIAEEIYRLLMECPQH